MSGAAGTSPQITERWVAVGERSAPVGAHLYMRPLKPLAATEHIGQAHGTCNGAWQQPVRKQPAATPAQ